MTQCSQDQGTVQLTITIPSEYAKQIQATADLQGQNVEEVILSALEGYGHAEYGKAVSLLEQFDEKGFLTALGEESGFEIVKAMLERTAEAYRFFSDQYKKSNVDFPEEDEIEE